MNINLLEAEIESATELRAYLEDNSTAQIWAAHQPSDFLYFQYGNSACTLTQVQEEKALKLSTKIGEILQQGLDDGTPANIGVETISLLLGASDAGGPQGGSVDATDLGVRDHIGFRKSLACHRGLTDSAAILMTNRDFQTQTLRYSHNAKLEY
ncbi:hypothetical protein A9Q96_06755 [Rhodobacterales bacterium 52_120_T64]|nr:hypothetical protein A9Q96_06755 [Rhodobacterales bacterium 52_120_T64]